MSATLNMSLATSEAAPVKNIAVNLARPEFERIKRILAGDAGIELTEDKMKLVHSRLQKRLRVIGIADFKSYCDFVESFDGKAERREMLNSLTTNLTRFFREPHHFKHLAQEVLPPLLENAQKGDAVRIWSAGCSSGQEPYSIAATLLALCPKAVDLNVKILASDIDQHVLRDGRTASYPENQIRHMPDQLRSRFFEKFDGPRSDMYVANPALKSLIAFNELNLNADSWPMRKKFDVIFCRNTVIYFNEADQARIWTRFAENLNRGGYMYIGHSERLSGPAADKFTKTSSTTTYLYKG